MDESPSRKGAPRKGKTGRRKTSDEKVPDIVVLRNTESPIRETRDDDVETGNRSLLPQHSRRFDFRFF